jgi:hypothetical protein
MYAPTPVHGDARFLREAVRTRPAQFSLVLQVREVGVDEVPTVSVIRQEFARKGRLAHAVRSRNDVNTRTHRRALTMIAEIALEVSGEAPRTPQYHELGFLPEPLTLDR